MKSVYIEGLGLVEGHFSGVGHYILGILRGLDSTIEKEKLAGHKTPKIRVIIPYDTVKKFKKFNFKYIGYKVYPLSMRYMSGLDHRGLLLPIDLWCGPGFYIFTRFAAMPLIFSKYATVIYDISFELYKQFSEDSNAKFLSPRTKASVKSAKKVITISNNAKQEIVDFYHVDPSLVAVATPGVDQHYLYRRSSDEIRRVKQKYDINGKYILSLSNLEPRKNLDGLVEAYCNLSKEIRKDVGLLLVGVNGWKTEKLFTKIISKIKHGYNITRPSSYISDDDIPAILSGAELLVYPSHYEGFGMPPLEALACGTPVVCSNNSSLPEVVGDCAIMVNSSDNEALTKAIKHSLNNHSISKKILKDGPNRAEQFNWQKSAQTYYDIIRKNI
jgi:glycosyltransferase involved in cell wall biosynthesis